MAEFQHPFVQASTREAFETKLEAGLISLYLIAFIEDTKEIWTRGIYYPSPYSKEELDKLFEDQAINLEEKVETLNRILAGKADKADTYTKTDVDGKVATINSAIEAETSRATTAESTITTNLNTEIGRAKAEEARIEAKADTVATNVANEITRARAAEKVNADAITAEQDRASSVELTLSRSKANITDLSNVMAEDIVNNSTVEGIEEWTRELLEKDSFINLWNAACGLHGRYNGLTGYFELNGLTDITYELAKEIYAIGPVSSVLASGKYHETNIRTNLPWTCRTGNYTSTIPYANGIALFESCPELEVITFNHIWKALTTVSFEKWAAGTDLLIRGADKLREILGVLALVGKNPYGLRNLPNLEEIRIGAIRTTSSFYLTGCPKLSLDSIKYIAEKMNINTSSMTLIVDPDVYNKLIDESNTEWNAALTTAVSRNIIFALES